MEILAILTFSDAAQAVKMIPIKPHSILSPLHPGSMTPFVKHICVAFENLRGFLRSVKGEIFLSEKPTDNKKYSK